MCCHLAFVLDPNAAFFSQCLTVKERQVNYSFDGFISFHPNPFYIKTTPIFSGIEIDSNIGGDTVFLNPNVERGGIGNVRANVINIHKNGSVKFVGIRLPGKSKNKCRAVLTHRDFLEGA